ncbi:MAG: S-methyl-5-thioribose-1-phosphate isomerase [Oscillospiraceae bacterium]|nr:S-methyl-5-thioribose-1-phosphate isomerase [Oscillospiraceae bacterium]
MKNITDFETVGLNADNSALVIIDQTKLPNEIEFLSLSSQPEIWTAINTLQVRGAPAIGVAAAIGVYLAAKSIDTADYNTFRARFAEAKRYLASSRPTAVNLFWALDRMEKTVTPNRPVSEIKQALLNEALAIKNEDISVCKAIGEHGLNLINDGDGILTHCNAGQLAAVSYGTALAPVYAARERGYKLKVFADETRPLLQGARLTAFELSARGIDTTLICDNMASQVMKNGWIQAVFTGCDRVAANGDVCNKIGTSGVAILAKHYGVPFYVCAPTSTIDISTAVGGDIPIEERDPREVTDMWYEKRMAPEGINVYNPAFDVTPGDLVTAIITEHGIIKPPYGEKLINN